MYLRSGTNVLTSWTAAPLSYHGHEQHQQKAKFTFQIPTNLEGPVPEHDDLQNCTPDLYYPESQDTVTLLLA
jgi:hypothetical protein